MESQTERAISKTFYVMRMFAIISVAAAHCGAFTGFIPENLRAMFGTIGVPVFLICSGYYFSPASNINNFWARKRKIIIPWLLWGVITLIIQNSHNGWTFSKLIPWTMGYRTWLYYVPILIAFYIIFQFGRSNKWIVFWIFIFFISFVLTYKGILKAEYPYMTRYQNPFNHIGFFVLGIILRKIKCERLIECKFWIKIAVLIIFLTISILYLKSGIIGYWASIYSIPFEVLAAIIIFWCSWEMKNVPFLTDVGKHTYFIFFVHMQIGNRIADKCLSVIKHFLVFPELLLVLLKPLLVVIITYLIWKLLRWGCIHLKIYDKSWILAI